MEILTSQLPSGGYGYDFSSISLKPMTFLEMVNYMESVPSSPIERYLYDIKLITREEPLIRKCYVMDLDFLIFFKKLISLSEDLTYDLTFTCPKCKTSIKKKISLDRDIHFTKIDENIMNGARIELNGHTYDANLPTVDYFMDVLNTVLRYNQIQDLNIIKTLSLVGDFTKEPNKIQDDVLGATHSDITLLIALRNIYFNRVDPVEVFCPKCNEDVSSDEERRSETVSVDSLIVDFFRDICVNSPIDGSKILFK